MGVCHTIVTSCKCLSCNRGHVNEHPTSASSCVPRWLRFSAQRKVLFYLLQWTKVCLSRDSNTFLGKGAKNWHFFRTYSYIGDPPIGTFRTQNVTFWFRTLDSPP